MCHFMFYFTCDRSFSPAIWSVIFQVLHFQSLPVIALLMPVRMDRVASPIIAAVRTFLSLCTLSSSGTTLFEIM